jgi:hypothetical protein
MDEATLHNVAVCCLQPWCHFPRGQRWAASAMFCKVRCGSRVREGLAARLASEWTRGFSRRTGSALAVILLFRLAGHWSPFQSTTPRSDTYWILAGWWECAALALATACSIPTNQPTMHAKEKVIGSVSAVWRERQAPAAGLGSVPFRPNSLQRTASNQCWNSVASRWEIGVPGVWPGGEPFPPTSLQ